MSNFLYLVVFMYTYAEVHANSGLMTSNQLIELRFDDVKSPYFNVHNIGLNLVEATRVIMFDPWWNPAVEEQVQ